MRLILAMLLTPLATPALADPVQDAMQDYSEFATYDAGIIRPGQLTEEIFADVTFIDTRAFEEFEQSTIPGARHIEWRDIFGQIDEIPTDGKVVLFCNTGALSAQAVFGLRVLGRENVLVLQSGFNGWRENAAYKPK